MKHYAIAIDGMGCEMCVKRVTEALNELGCTDITVAVGSAAAAFDGAPEALTEAINDLGFDVKAIKEA